jgi:uncharacterized protein (DUF58 family)
MTASRPDRILQRIDWQVIRRLDGLLQGDYRSLLYGQGIDFADLREYQIGDDIRYIDWNVTARTGNPHIRQYVEDREITAWFLLDLSPSLQFGTTDADKQTVLVDFVATMARLLTRHGNRVGAMLALNDVERVVPPRGGRLQVLRILHEMLSAPKGRPAGMTDLGVLLTSAMKAIRRRSLIVIVSDFISSPGWEAPLSVLSRRHEVVAVCIRDPRERQLPDVGAITIEDSETGEQMYVDTHDGALRKRFLDAAQLRQETLRRSFRRLGIDSLWLETDADLLTAFVRFAALRGKRRKTGK